MTKLLEDTRSQEFQRFAEISTDLAIALRVYHSSNWTEAVLDDDFLDVMFHFYELTTLEGGAEDACVRRACTAVIDGHGFNRNVLADIEFSSRVH